MEWLSLLWLFKFVFVLQWFVSLVHGNQFADQIGNVLPSAVCMMR